MIDIYIIDFMNIEAVDLNLLKAFEALYEERHVTHAGARIGLAQPSMSNALARLRRIFDDELFARTPSGMEPTERAIKLAPEVANALNTIRSLMQPTAPFDPSTSEAEFSVATSDAVLARYGAGLVQLFQDAAPGIDIRFRPIAKETVFAKLDDRSLDAAVGVFGHIPSRFYQHDAFMDEFVCIARKHHPSLKRGLTRKKFANIPQILMTLREDGRGRIDDALKEFGLQRRVVLTVGQFSVVPGIVASTDYIATVPKSIAESPAIKSDCDVFRLPFPLPPWSTLILWSQATSADPAKKFAVNQFREFLIDESR